MNIAAQRRFWPLRPTLTTPVLELGCWLAAALLAVALAISPTTAIGPAAPALRALGVPQSPDVLAYRQHCIDRVLARGAYLRPPVGYAVDAGRQAGRRLPARLTEADIDRRRDRFYAVNRHRFEIRIAQLDGSGDDRPFEAETMRLEDAALELTHAAHFATQSELANRDQVGPGGPVSFVGSDRQGHREVRCGLAQSHPARRVDEDIVLSQVEVGAALQHRDQHVQPVEVNPVDRSARRAEAARRGETLELDQEGAAPLQRDVHDVADLAQRAVLQEGAAGVGDLVHAAVAHLENADLIGGTESILLAAQDPEHLVALAFEIEDGVDDVLEHARPRDRALFVH